MDENILKLRVGIFVVLAMIILGILIFLNSEGWNRQYTIYIKPISAPGVTKGTPIRKNGILIGRVTSVDTQDDHVLLGLSVNEKERVYANEIASIGSESLFGDAVVEILPKPKAERGDPVGASHVLDRVAVKRNPMEIVDVALNLEAEITETLAAVRKASAAVESTGNGISGLTTTVQEALDDPESDFKKLLVEFRGVSKKAQVALDNFNRIFENVNEIVGDEELKGEIRRSVGKLPDIFDDIRKTIIETRKTIATFKSVPGKVNKNLDNLVVFTDALKKDGPEVLSQVRASLENVDGLVSQIKQFTQSLSKLQDSDGTINKLLNDTEIYDNILETAENVRDLSARLEPMVDDLRSFSDAIARDPGVIGVRGALDRRPAKTGYKGTAGRDEGLFR